MNQPSHRIEPFRGLLYNQAKVGDLGSVIAPPYDLIGKDRQDQLYRRSEFNVVRLELNRDEHPYRSAAELLADWLAHGVLQRASRPAMYLYTQSFNLEGRRLQRHGLLARIRLEEFSQGGILPHERTFAAAKEDRMRLLTATRTQLSSIFGIYPAASQELRDELRDLIGQVAAEPPMLSVVDDLDITNQLRAIEERGQIGIIQRALENPRMLIADGHHRYETALRYQHEMRSQKNNREAPQPYDYTMMTLTSFDDAGLVILPTHRVIHDLSQQAIENFRAHVSEYFEVEQFTSPEQALPRLNKAGRGAIAVAIRDERELRLLRPAASPSALVGSPSPLAELDVSILHVLVFERLLRLSESDVKKGGNIEYTVDADSALKSVSDGRSAAAFLINAPSVHDVARVADSGATMPEKSTYFFPKLVTGLVMNPLED